MALQVGLPEEAVRRDLLMQDLTGRDSSNSASRSLTLNIGPACHLRVPRCSIAQSARIKDSQCTIPECEPLQRCQFLVKEPVLKEMNYAKYISQKKWSLMILTK